MSQPTLYDDDILLWSEQQAEVIRALGRSRRDLPNELDIENVAEEIESVGRSELAAVESQLQNILVHLMKIAVAPDADPVRRWRMKIAAFHAEIRRRYSRSMRQRIDFGELWAVARELTLLSAERPEELEAILPVHPPFEAEELLGARIDSLELVQRLRPARQSRQLS